MCIAVTSLKRWYWRISRHDKRSRWNLLNCKLSQPNASGAFQHQDQSIRVGYRIFDFGNPLLGFSQTLVQLAWAWKALAIDTYNGVVCFYQLKCHSTEQILSSAPYCQEESQNKTVQVQVGVCKEECLVGKKDHMWESSSFWRYCPYASPWKECCQT